MMYQRSNKTTMPKPTLLLCVLLAGCCISSIHSFSPMSIVSRKSTTSAIVSTTRSTSNTHQNNVGPRGPLSMPFISVRTMMASTTSSEESSTTIASSTSDGEALQSLFAKHCDEGLMTEDDLRNVPEIKDMLEQGDLLSSELTEIWKAAPKFPQVVDPLGEEDMAVKDKIDVDSFIQVYRDIDDLFDNDDAAESKEEAVVAAVAEEEDGDELKEIFATLGNADKLSFSQLRQWEEITVMIEEEKTLGEDEVVTLWEGVLGVKGTTDGEMDLKGFVDFNNALDDLFELEDDEMEEIENAVMSEAEEEEAAPPAQPTPPRPIITEEDLPPGVLFSQLANENYLVSKEDLSRWGELTDMLKEGELTTDELNALFDNASKAPGTKDMLDEDGFCSLYDAVDALFEDIDDDDNAEEDTPQQELKEELLEFIEDIAQLSSEEGQQICGLDCSELERERVLEVSSELEREPYNQVVAVSASTGVGAVKKEELVGTWDLIYSSSSTMKYNEGLTGLAGGLTRFGGLQQKLTATKYLSDVEYTEKMVGKFGGQEAEVRVTGDWDLRTEVSLFTGKPSNVLSVVPDKVFYASRADKADHWKSLGPMNLLVLTYLDEDLRIMRGNTSTDTLFILRRSK